MDEEVSMNYAIVLAAGSGKRMGSKTPKQFIELAGKPVLSWTLEAFEKAECVDAVVLVTTADLVDVCRDRFALGKVVQVVAGGAERQDSVACGLAAVPDEADVIAVHDGARAFVMPEDIDAVITKAQTHGAAVLGTLVTDTVKRVDGQVVVETLDRSVLRAVQTPQAFCGDVIRKAHLEAKKTGYLGTDDTALVEQMGVSVVVVPGRVDNVKITTPDDLDLGLSILAKRGIVTAGLRIGQGYDVHQLVKGRPLILGGVNVPHEMGLLGHSDADVLTHVIIDAILGALGVGDIGQLFPDTDAQYKDISSLVLLARVADVVCEKNAKVLSVDATVMAQRPKLAPHIVQMREKLSQTLGVDMACISVKATTTEKLGFVGREEGMAAQAVALVQIG
jgi:2-C-methyl-D-erythritol 4-phosphate cytidylyltransferase/2-C-methyl-D-erythritol 2,4-cyclodiphosphate synthase